MGQSPRPRPRGTRLSRKETPDIGDSANPRPEKGRKTGPREGKRQTIESSGVGSYKPGAESADRRVAERGGVGWTGVHRGSLRWDRSVISFRVVGVPERTNASVEWYRQNFPLARRASSFYPLLSAHVAHVSVINPPFFISPNLKAPLSSSGVPHRKISWWRWTWVLPIGHQDTERRRIKNLVFGGEHKKNKPNGSWSATREPRDAAAFRCPPIHLVVPASAALKGRESRHSPRRTSGRRRVRS